MTPEPDLPTVVVDASALVNALTTAGEKGSRTRTVLRDHRLAAPEQLAVETFHAIRGRVLGGKLDETKGARAIDELAHTAVELVPTRLLLDRMWELRDNVSGCDAAYVAAAEHLGVPLVTADRRLAAVKTVRCEVRTP